MAGLADTAKLLASLDLDSSKFNAGAKSAIGSVSKLESSFDKIGAAAKRGVSTAVLNLTRLGAVAAAGISGAVFTGLQDLKTLESAVTSVDGAIAQMGETGQVSGRQIAGWANDIEASIGAAFDDKAITAATATLIRFGKVTPSNLRPAMVVMTDLAAKTGSVDSAATLLAKALADPEKAAGKLARTGVVLTKAQQDEIKALVKTGQTAKAQALLIDMLSKTTKGAAEASQGPYARALSTLADVSEDARKALAEGFLPLIEKVATKLSTALADPKIIQGIRDFGQTLAGSLDKFLGIAERLPWGSIADSLKIAGAGAKAILDAFVGMPPWVQTAVITGWGLNKLTGGALGDIVGELGKGFIKGVLGINAGVVNINAGVVNGGGLGGGGTGGAGELAAGAGGILAPGMAAAVVAVTVPLVMGYLPRLFPGQAQAGAGAGSQPPLTVSTSQGSFTLTSQQHAVMSGLMPSFDRLAYSSGRTQLASEAVAALAERQMREVANHAASEHADLASIKDATTASSAAAVAKLDALHTDLQTQLGVLKTSKDSAAIAASATALVKDILMGAGGVTSNTNALERLKNARQFTAPGSADRKAIDAAIASIGTHIKGEEWIRAQVDGARKIVDSNAPTHKKLDTLDSTVENLLRHGDTNAAEMIRQLAAQKDITITINGLKATVTATDVNEGTTTAKRKGRFSTTASSWT